jgi:hypothetical protein
VLSGGRRELPHPWRTVVSSALWAVVSSAMVGPALPCPVAHAAKTSTSTTTSSVKGLLAITTALYANRVWWDTEM